MGMYTQDYPGFPARCGQVCVGGFRHGKPQQAPWFHQAAQEIRLRPGLLSARAVQISECTWLGMKVIRRWCGGVCVSKRIGLVWMIALGIGVSLGSPRTLSWGILSRPYGTVLGELIYPGLPRISCTLLQAGLRMRLSKPHEAPWFHQAAQETRVRPGLHSAVPFGTAPIHPDR